MIRPEGCVCPWKDLGYHAGRMVRIGQNPGCTAHPNECAKCGEERGSEFCCPRSDALPVVTLIRGAA